MLSLFVCQRLVTIFGRDYAMLHTSLLVGRTQRQTVRYTIFVPLMRFRPRLLIFGCVFILLLVFVLFECFVSKCMYLYVRAMLICIDFDYVSSGVSAAERARLSVTTATRTDTSEDCNVRAMLLDFVLDWFSTVCHAVALSSVFACCPCE